MATTQTLTSPTPASEKIHIHSAEPTGTGLTTIPGTMEPIEARPEPTSLPADTTTNDTAAPAPVAAAAPAPDASMVTTAEAAPAVAGADVPRKRSLLKRRSLRSKAEPKPAVEAPSATAAAQAETAQHPPTKMPVPEPAPAPAPTASEPVAVAAAVSAAAEEPTRKRSLLKRRSLRSKPDTTITTAGAATEQPPQDTKPIEAPAVQPEPTTSPVDGVLSRDYTKLHGPSTRSVKSASIASPPVVGTAPASPSATRSRPQSRATANGAPGYGPDSSEGEYSDVESDEPDVASYMSPVSHGGRKTGAGGQRHRRAQTFETVVAPRPVSAATELVEGGVGGSSASRARSRRSGSRPRSMGAVGGGGLHHAGTVASHRTGATNRTTMSVVSEGGAFGRGAGTIGPGAIPDPEESVEFRERARAATLGLGAKQNKKIFNEELKEGKRLSEILRAEGKVERQALQVALKELSELQASQKASVKGEGRAHTAHAKSLKAAHAAELVLLEAQRKHQLAQTELAAKAQALEYARVHALEATQAVATKNREVDLLRAQKGADAREREVKMTLIQGKTRR